MLRRLLHPADPRAAAIIAGVSILVLCAAAVVVRSTLLADLPRLTVYNQPREVTADGGATTHNSAEAEIDGANAVLEASVLAVRRDPLPLGDGETGSAQDEAIVSVQLELRADSDLPADPGRVMLLLTSANGDVIRVSPTITGDLAPNLSELDLEADQAVTGWLSFIVPTDVHRGVVSFRPVGAVDFAADLPISW